MIFIEAFLISKNMENVEIWKEVVGYEELYKISNLGNIKSLNYNHTKKEKKLKSSIDTYGYLCICLFKNTNKKTRRIHQLVAEAFLNHTSNGYKSVINHKNFIRTDNRVENLEIISARENTNQKHLKSISKYTGVCWYKPTNKWKSAIKINGKLKYLGYYETEIEASKAYENKLSTLNNL